jgi:hypothetical protein
LFGFQIQIFWLNCAWKSANVKKTSKKACNRNLCLQVK